MNTNTFLFFGSVGSNSAVCLDLMYSMKNGRGWYGVEIFAKATKMWKLTCDILYTVYIEYIVYCETGVEGGEIGRE